MLKGDLIDIGKGKDAYSIHADSDYIGFEIDIEYQKYLNVNFEYIAESDILPLANLETNFYNNPGDVSLFNNNFIYLKAERVPPEHNYRANLAAVKQANSLGYKGENVPLYIALNKLESVQLESVKHKNAKTNNLISNIDAWMNEITPGTHVISTYYNELDIVKVGYQFDSANDVTPEFSPINVGFGFTYTLPVITAILIAKKGDLLIIENPESHLHPQGQAKLGELIAKAASEGVQIIIESHSDHLFNGIRVAIKNGVIKHEDAAIFYFERDLNSSEHVTTISQPIVDQDGRISHKPIGFFDEYSKQLDELIK
jgi:predicted ATPase